MLNNSILTTEVNRFHAAYRELLKIDNAVIRSSVESTLCQLRDRISQLTLVSPQVVQETNEHIARAEKAQAKYLNCSYN